MTTSRESVYFHAFFDSPTSERYKLTRALSAGRSTMKCSFKRRRYNDQEERYEWTSAIDFELPAERGYEREALVVAREQETGVERPPELRKLLGLRAVGEVKQNDPEEGPISKRVPLKRCASD